MSSSGYRAPTPPAKIHEATFIGIAWGGTALAWLFFGTRIVIRIKAFRRLYADDAMVLIACLFLMTNTIIWQFSKDELYEIIAVETGQLYPPPSDLPERAQRYLRRSVVVIVFFYSGLWAIKLSFMLFFKRLGRNVRHQKVMFWTILAIIIATWFACLGTIQYRCLTGSFEYIKTVCSGSASVAFQRNALRWTMIMDVVTDALIILIPINLLWKVQISLRKKLALAVVFSITVVIIVFAIIRVVVVSSYSHQLDETWLCMWSSIEQTVSILVACLASYRALFTRSNRPKHQHIRDEGPEAPKSSAPRLPLLTGSKFTITSLLDKVSKSVNDITDDDDPSLMLGPQTVASAAKKDHWDEYNEHASGSAEHILPLNKVHVRHDI